MTMLKDTPSPFDVLLVEDELADARLVGFAIRQSGIACTLHHVTDGHEALAFLKREAGRYDGVPQPDLILLDLNMPRMNGGEFLAAVKAQENLASIPVVVLTTSAVERDVEHAYRLHASGYITKPVDMDEFTTAMRHLLEYWRMLTRLPKKE